MLSPLIRRGLKSPGIGSMGRFHAVAAPGLVILLGLAFSLIPLLRGEMFFYWDNAQQQYPQTVFLSRWLSAGTIPQWWPEVGSGLPTIGEGAHYHPSRLLLALIFPPTVAFMLEIGIYLAVAGLGTYLFLREFHLHRAACVMGAMSQMFGSFSVVFVRNMALHRALFVFPLAMLVAERFAKRSTVNLGIAASVLVALTLLAGHPTMTIVTVVATSFYVLFRLLQRSWRRNETLPIVSRRVAGAGVGWGLAVLLGFGLAGIQVIPTLRQTQQSIRQGGLSFEYATTSLGANLRYLPQVFFPFAYHQGDWLNQPDQWGSIYNIVPSSGFYVGAVPAVLAVLALWWRRRWPDPGWPLAVGGLVAVGFALGSRTPLFPALWSLPGMNGFRYPGRFLLWASFSLSCLGALGFHRLLARARLKKFSSLDLLPFAGLAVVLSALAGVLWILQPRLHSGILGSLLLCFAALGLSACLLLRRHQRAFLLLALLFVGVDLWVFRARSGYAPTVSINEALKPSQTAEVLRRDRDQFRVMSLVLGEDGARTEELKAFVRPNLSTIWGLETADYWLSLVPKRYYALREGIVWELLNSPDSAPKLAKFLGSLNVKYVVSPRAVTLSGWEKVHETELTATWKNPEILPRAFLVSEVVPEKIQVPPDWVAMSGKRLKRYRSMVRDWSTREADSVIVDNILAQSIEYRRTAVASAPCGGVRRSELAAGAEVKTTQPEPDVMTFKANAREPALLVISANFFPGWAATVNGLPAEIYRTNWVGMGVCVPAGESDVVLRFKTPGLRTGLVVSGLSLLFSLALVIVTRKASFRSQKRNREG
jgi:Bacterial membrane protein YfhO